MAVNIILRIPGLKIMSIVGLFNLRKIDNTLRKFF
jgi:hypothetical protein